MHALNAFDGVLSHLRWAFEGGFVSGLPYVCFDSALLWQHWNPIGGRVTSDEGYGVCLSGWSWVGWGGNSNSECRRSAANHFDESSDALNDEQRSWVTRSTHS